MLQTQVIGQRVELQGRRKERDRISLEVQGGESAGLNHTVIGTLTFIAIALLAFGGTFVALRAFRLASASMKLVDTVGELKHHGADVPMVGGLAIFAGYLLAISLYALLFEASGFFLLASALLVATGTLDDRYVLNPLSRLVIQIVIALIAAFGAGLVVETIGAPFSTEMVGMGWLSIPFTILIIVGGINAWNMIDGIDGLASILAFVSLTCLLVVGGSTVPSLQASLLALLFGIGAFFLFNLPLRRFRRQRTFLGDAGSMFLGLAVVWHSLALSQGTTAAMSPIIALWFVALPVYDVITTTLRRLLKGQSPLAGDRQHLHHLLQDHGLSTRQTLFVLSILALLGGGIGLFGHFVGASDGVMFASFASCGAGYFLTVRRLAKGVSIPDRAAVTA